MANASSKKQATANVEALALLHKVSLALNTLYVLSYFFLSRPATIKPFLFLSLPAWIIETMLERMGRPKYAANGSLVNPGENLAQAGLTEAMWDVVYVTFIIDVLAIVVGRNVVWWLYAVIPVYAGYKAFGLASPLLGKGAPAPAAAAETEPQNRRERRRTRQSVKT
ncbi:uncharacterized protein V1510DRAFT_379556 [Dipodascopsis tothii]|uniref:uncharacterized protein n=1 Tax=Dipodascopsis tothii TaxID=44089 RepID=UPI0034CE69BA